MSSTHLIYVISVVSVWWCPSHILFTLLVLFVCGGVQHILVFCVVFCLSYLRYLCCLCVFMSSTHLIYVISVVSVWWCPSHILFTLLVLFVCGGVHHISYLRY